MMRMHLLAGAMAVVPFVASGQTASSQYGSDPELPDPQRGLLPSMAVPRPAAWGDDLPTVPEGYTIAPIATDLMIPRQLLVLPNGDILVAEGSGGGAPVLRPKDLIAGFIKSLGKSSVKGGNRLTLLRDGDGDGTYESQGIFAEGLNAPYGLALIDDAIYVANQDAVVRFDYSDGQTEASGEPVTLTELPSEINHHWTKSMTASADGRTLYVGIGSNSNITERGIEVEEDRAMIWEIDVETGAHRPYATGLRNPTALTIQPETGQLWAVVNERDEIGPGLVPDYLTAVQEGGFYGWPYSYWGQIVDPRAQPQDPDMVASAIEPDYALGAHVAALGVAFSTPAMGPEFSDGVFVGEHGSWNRSDPVGYRVVFVPFADGRPSGDPIDVVSGFLLDEGNARGRPVGVAVDPRGALLVADDLSNTIWRVTPPQSQAAAAVPDDQPSP
ncbi:sorbosone dehydrogenase family protein [Rubellimicrobium rubrum]|uniref:Sorbosone dehydrogenase family protein n=1 Tax=Rubellimicrobium rubrum TaxID=2585369 RepID=A0A5C4MYH7_9RHOB|nr:sorbosone dehydrogenase family protein [Rubellimicrobium rubrum]TNC50527.1 sorbosone dehydrogenase family protein [Rubellimicrobium rubrum]